MSHTLEPSPKVRWAVIGAGNIAQVAVLPAFSHAKETSELVAIVSSDLEKQEKLSEKYGVAHTGDYAQLDDQGRYKVKLPFDETDAKGNGASP